MTRGVSTEEENLNQASTGETDATHTGSRSLGIRGALNAQRNPKSWAKVHKNHSVTQVYT